MLVIYRGLYIFFAEIYEENAEAWRADYLNLGVFVSNSSLTRTTCPWAEGVVVKEPRRQCHYITNDPRSFTSYFCASYFRTSYYQVHIEFDQYEGSRACGIQLCGIKVFELSKHNGRLYNRFEDSSRVHRRKNWFAHRIQHTVCCILDLLLASC